MFKELLKFVDSGCCLDFGIKVAEVLSKEDFEIFVMCACLGYILNFLLYPFSGTTSIVPRPFLTRIRRHGPLYGFNMMTRF